MSDNSKKEKVSFRVEWNFESGSEEAIAIEYINNLRSTVSHKHVYSPPTSEAASAFESGRSLRPSLLQGGRTCGSRLCALRAALGESEIGSDWDDDDDDDL